METTVRFKFNTGSKYATDQLVKLLDTKGVKYPISVRSHQQFVYRRDDNHLYKFILNTSYNVCDAKEVSFNEAWEYFNEL